MCRVLSKRSLLISFALCVFTSLFAKVEVGKTYRIVPVEASGKSLFVKNSSLDNEAPVVLWTETDVPAQQWTAMDGGSDTRFSFQNVYTGAYLNGLSSNLKQSNTKTVFTLDAVDEPQNIYRIKFAAKYLSFNSTEDGVQPLLSGTSKEWKLVEVAPQSAFNTTMRDRIADGFLTQFQQRKGALMYTFINGSWGEAETMEAVLDMFEQTGADKYSRVYQGCYRYFRDYVGGDWTGGTLKSGYDWYGYDFNDDVMWMIIGAARAGILLDNTQCREDARRNFDLIYKRAYLPYCGLLRWAEHTGDRNGANSCINGPAEVAACYIGIAEADESYFEIARNLYAKQRQYLFNPSTGHVDDAVVFNPDNGSVISRNSWASTYNQGTMLGAAVLLYQHYGDEMYRKDADRILAFARENLCDANGIIKVCQNADGDFQGFKGILMRYAGLYARVFNSEETRQWLIANALHAYNNMNSKHYGHSAWLTKADESGRFGEVDYTRCAFGASTSITAAFSVPVSDSPTGIGAVTLNKTADSGNSWFTLSGIPVRGDSLVPGIYIHNNKKVVVK